MDLSNLKEWFLGRPKWQQEAARRCLENGTLLAADIQELLPMCIAEAACEGPVCKGLSACIFEVGDATKPLRLESISNVEGINALAPSKPLEFGKSSLCIIYGRNGAGKSGYVRLLKHACGSRNPGVLLSNIFESDGINSCATISFTDVTEDKTQQWSGNALEELKGVEIYDTACGLIYINEENEVAYEPALLRMFTEITNACTTLSQRIQAEIVGMVSRKPSSPPEFTSTSAASWYRDLSAATSPTEIESRTGWNEEHQARLNELNRRLAEPDPASKAKSLRRQQTILVQLKTDLKRDYDAISDKNCAEYTLAKADAIAKRKAADEDAERVFRDSRLSGVGSQSWRLLWEAARKYSEKEAYQGVTFPNVEGEAVCVLCQQELSQESRQRFVSFEDFVKGELQTLASEAEGRHQDLFRSLPELLSHEALSLKLEAAAASDQSILAQLTDFRTSLGTRKEACISGKEVPESPKKTPLVNILLVARRYAAQARAFDKDSFGQNRPELERETKELSARKWLNQQRNAIDLEVSRLRSVQLLEEAKRLTNTTGLSKQKSALTHKLITEAYTQRFRNELKRLGASRIDVDLEKTKAEVGRVYHRIFLKNAKRDAKAADILSEGEFRIVSLAAFLADTEGRGTKTPFIFDDPISSLDHVYEEATARRLAELSQTRQVIVFTHRLSLVALLEKYADKLDIKPNHVCLSLYMTGEIAELPIDLKRTIPAVNELLNERIAEAKKAFRDGDAAYATVAKALCRDIRTLLERVVEVDLLNEIVKRFSPEVQTKGKIHALASITAAECQFIDDLMTKYSRYEHSQPEEAPVELPRPDDIKSDLDEIMGFIMTRKGRNRAK